MRSVFFTMLFAAVSVAAPPPAKVVTVGLSFRLNQKFDTTVFDYVQGVEVAKSLFERENPGVRIRLKRFPFGSDLTSVEASARQIIAADVPVVIGGESSDEALVLGEKLGPAGIVLVSPTASSPKVTDGRPFVFRICPSDDIVGDKMARFVIENLHPRRIGVFHNVSTTYTDYLSERFRAAVGGRAVVKDERVLGKTMDLSSAIASLLNPPPEVIAMFTQDTDLINFVAQSILAGAKLPIFIGSDGWGSNEYIRKKIVEEIPGAHGFVAYRNNYWVDDGTRELSRAFRASILARSGAVATVWSAIGFDAAWITFTAIKNARASRGEAIRESLAAIKLKDLVTTHSFSFGPGNSPKRDLHIYRLSKEGVKLEATVE